MSMPCILPPTTKFPESLKLPGSVILYGNPPALITVAWLMSTWPSTAYTHAGVNTAAITMHILFVIISSNPVLAEPLTPAERSELARSGGTGNRAAVICRCVVFRHSRARVRHKRAGWSAAPVRPAAQFRAETLPCSRICERLRLQNAPIPNIAGSISSQPDDGSGTVPADIV